MQSQGLPISAQYKQALVNSITRSWETVAPSKSSFFTVTLVIQTFSKQRSLQLKSIKNTTCTNY